MSNRPRGGLRLGAVVTNTNVAYHPKIERRYRLLSQAILAGASPQLRNMASVGGQPDAAHAVRLLLRHRDALQKRALGAGCPAIAGFNRYHAILGTSQHCIVVHPSDMCVALAALAAVVHGSGPGGSRAIPFRDFHRLPGDTPHLDTNKRPDEIITAVHLPAQGFADHYAYLKVRDRTSYVFALVSVAAALRMDGETIQEARLTLGGVAHKPWRDSSGGGVVAWPARLSCDLPARRRHTGERRPGVRPQHVQDRAGQARHRPRPRHWPPPWRRE
jgi:xanthine dehydrogenase YagS FAD-binding subunit